MTDRGSGNIASHPSSLWKNLCQPKQAELEPTENEAEANDTATAFVFLGAQMEAIRLPLRDEGGFGHLPTKIQPFHWLNLFLMKVVKMLTD